MEAGLLAGGSNLISLTLLDIEWARRKPLFGVSAFDRVPSLRAFASAETLGAQRVISTSEQRSG